MDFQELNRKIQEEFTPRMLKINQDNTLDPMWKVEMVAPENGHLKIEAATQDALGGTVLEFEQLSDGSPIILEHDAGKCGFNPRGVFFSTDGRRIWDAQIAASPANAYSNRPLTWQDLAERINEFVSEWEETVKEQEAKATAANKMKGALKIGVVGYHCGTWEVVDGKMITKMFRCKLVEAGVDGGEITIEGNFNTVISGLNDSYEEGYVLLVDKNTLVEVENTYQIEHPFLEEGNEIWLAGEDEGGYVLYQKNPEVRGWNAPAVDQ